jgi:uncharacterized protein YciW
MRKKGGFLMSFTQDVPAERLAKLVHHYQEILVNEFEESANAKVAVPWDQAPEGEKRRLIAATQLALLELSSAESSEGKPRSYFATPGEAEWGS